MSTSKTQSADGTALAFEVAGDGPPIVFVGGAFNTRSTTAPLAAALRDRFIMLNFDRRAAETAATRRRTRSSARWTISMR